MKSPQVRWMRIVGLVVLSSCSTTEPDRVDTVPPDVLSISPVDGSADVTIHATVSVVFSEPIASDAGTLGALSLERGGKQVAGSVERTGPNTLQLVPVGGLDLGETYTVVLAAGVADTAGNASAEQRSWSFSTLGSSAPTLSETDLVGEIARLSHDSMAGRGSGTADELRAAEYLRDQFTSLGLQPGVASFFQQFEIPADRVGGQTGVMSQNVIGVLPGEGGLADEWVVVGAHYDHAGVRELTPGSPEIFNGADDNASGTALMLELARKFRDFVAAGGTGGEPRRSVMFHAYGAEELGLIGSDHYCDNPTVSLYDVSAMINFDMVGRLRDDELFVSGLWTSTEWDDLLESRNKHDLDIVDKQDCQSCSDYACFRRNNVPAVWFFTGFHPQYTTPEDDVDLINGPGLAMIADLSISTLIHLAVRPEALRFDRTLP